MSDGGEFTVGKAGERCCPVKGCPTEPCPCFGEGSLFQAMQADPAAFTFESCSQSHDKDTIQAFFSNGGEVIGVVGGCGGWWGPGICFDDYLTSAAESQISPGSHDLTKINKGEAVTCVADIRKLLKDEYGVDSEQDCDFVYT